MSKLGVATARKTKYKPTSNNPFQGITAISFNVNRTPFPSAFLTFQGNPQDVTKNSIKPFIITRLKPSDPGGPGAAYGGNTRLEMGIAQAQNLSEEFGINLTFGVNNNGALAATDGITSIQIGASDDRGNPIRCFGTAEGGPGGDLREFVAGVFTKVTAAALPEPVTLRDGDNFKFNLQQAVEATGVAPEEATGTLYMVPEIIERLRQPGDEFTLFITIEATYNTTTTGGPVNLTNCRLQLRFVYSD